MPTTYAGAEWTPCFGMLLEPGRKGGGSDERATPVAAIYDPELTLDLPLEATVGTAMNALAHCAEAYYHPARTPRAARHADTGATAIGYALPLVVAEPAGIYGRTRLLEGAMRAAIALGDSGPLPRPRDGPGARRPLRPAAGRDERAVPARPRSGSTPRRARRASARFGAALGDRRPPRAVEELARLGGFERLRDFGVPERELDDVAAAIVAGRARRRTRGPRAREDVAGLLRSIW